MLNLGSSKMNFRVKDLLRRRKTENGSVIKQVISKSIIGIHEQLFLLEKKSTLVIESLTKFKNL